MTVLNAQHEQTNRKYHGLVLACMAVFLGFTLAVRAQEVAPNTADPKESVTYPYLDPEYQSRIEAFRADPARYTEVWRPQFHASLLRQGELKGDVQGFCYINGWWTPFLYRKITFPGGARRSGSGMMRSRDLLHWEHLPHTVPPTEDGATWTGSVLYDHNNSSGLFDEGGYLYMFERTSDPRTIELWHTDDGFGYVPFKGNPIITGPKGKGAFSCHDPCVFWHERTRKWHMFTTRGGVFHRTSNNLRDWSDPKRLEGNIHTEVVDVFPLTVAGTHDGSEVWVVSCAGRYYYLADFDGEELDVFSERIPMNWGPDHYAQLHCRETPDDRIVSMGMVNPQGPLAGEKEWTSINRKHMPFYCMGQTFPVECSVRTTADGPRLFQEPVREIEKLRTATRELKDIVLKPDENPIADWRGRLMDIELQFTIPEDSQTTEFGVAFYRDKGGVETVVGYNREKEQLFVDRSRSGYARDVPTFGRRYTAPMKPSGGKINIRVLVDESIVEAFGNDGRRVITAGIFAPPTAEGLALYTESGPVEVEHLAVHELKTTWRSNAEEKGDTPLRIRMQPNIRVKRGETTYLGARIWPYTARPRQLAWSVGDDAVAETAPDGPEHLKIVGASVGETTVTAGVAGAEPMAICEVHVVEP
mgnify:CR=1 FL=1